MKKQLVRKIRNAAIQACIEAGCADPASVRSVIRKASESVRPMSIAGVKAAFSKGQNVYMIELIPSEGHHACCGGS